MKNIQYPTLSDPRSYIQENLWTSVKKYPSARKRIIDSKVIKRVTGRRKPHICKSAFIKVPSLTLWSLSTLQLIMQIIKDKNKIGRH